ncbi:helix-turn-helix domain-containing protein [Mycolicibacterium chlorophenolicum]|uniref:helix-turn-helix domain-containing protein n=1 Tax=Mycolicibacterium chlorophenolicum TaxID=37916 RepID=UPI001F183342|nr:helix-turn-helix domain-containing protein [Mycolicibacterium chlorophenolicum]
MDPTVSDRQTRIDAAGGVKALAQLLGVSQYAVRRWRDLGRPLVPGALTVIADVEGVLVVNGEEYPRDLSVTIDIYPPAADDIRIAYALGDLDYIAELLGPEIAEQVDWEGEADREYVVTGITDITLH